MVRPPSRATSGRAAAAFSGEVHEVAVRQFAALRSARRAGCVDDGGDVVEPGLCAAVGQRLFIGAGTGSP